jgi:predicted metal-dependent phosphoesterase TrpH
LHVHSTASDGVKSPSEVVRMALTSGLSVLGITDHDTLGGIGEARRAAAGTLLEVIPGVEVNSEGDWGDLHFLGYYVDPDGAALQSRLETVREGRVVRARRMVDRLKELGMPVDWERVRALAGGHSVGRPHVARALLEQGYVSSVQEAFDRYIANGGPAYVPRIRLSPPEVIGAILEADGLPVIAHPAHSGRAVVEQIPEFVGFGLRGVEVYYPRHSAADVEMLLDLCRRHGLLATGGSDFHGPGSGEGAMLGSVCVPVACAARLREAAQGRVGD